MILSRRAILLASTSLAALAFPSGKALAQATGRTYWASAPTFYCDPVNGDDANSGLSGFPFKTLQGAYNAIKSLHDFGGHNPTLQLADGNYSTGTPSNSILLTAAGQLVGAELLLILGNETTPANVKLYADPTMPAIYARDQAILQLSGLSFETTGNGACAIHNDGQGAVVDYTLCRFGAFPGGSHIICDSGGFVNGSGQNWIDGGAISHMTVSSAAQVSHGGTHTVAGGLSFAYANGNRAPLLSVSDGGRYYGGAAFNGAGAGGATYGKQYAIASAAAQFNGTVWPGDQAGTIS